jgi:hypothetical protein
MKTDKKRSRKYLLGGALLTAFILAAPGTAQSEPGQCNDVQTRPVQHEMQLRKQMIKALEETKDHEQLNCLVSADDNLVSYYFVLRRASNHLKDTALVKTLLELPATAQRSDDRLPRVAQGLYAEIAANNSETTPEIKNMLFEKFKDDKTLSNRALHFIFETAAMNYPDTPDAEMTRRLVENGANLNSAVKMVTDQIEGEILVQKRKLGRIKTFTNQVLSQ